MGRFRRIGLRADCWYLSASDSLRAIIQQVSFSVASSFFAWVERSHTGQAYSAVEWHSARADDLSVVGVASHFEVLSLRMMLFLVPTFFLVFSICALYHNVRSSVTPIYTGRLQWVKFTPFQLMLSCLPHSRFRRWKSPCSVW